MPILDDTPRPEPIRWQAKRLSDYQLVGLLEYMIRLHGEGSRHSEEVRRELRDRGLTK